MNPGKNTFVGNVRGKNTNMNIKYINAFRAGGWPSLISILKILRLLLCGDSIEGGKNTNTETR